MHSSGPTSTQKLGMSIRKSKQFKHFCGNLSFMSNKNQEFMPSMEMMLLCSTYQIYLLFLSRKTSQVAFSLFISIKKISSIAFYFHSRSDGWEKVFFPYFSMLTRAHSGTGTRRRRLYVYVFYF